MKILRSFMLPVITGVVVLFATTACEDTLDFNSDDGDDGVPSSSSGGVARDEIDISNAIMLNSTAPDIADWPITSVKAPFEYSGDQMLCEWDKRLEWPTSPKNTVNANIVVFYWLDGVLYGLPQEYIRRENPWRPMKFWLPDGRGGRYRPTKGTMIGLMISGISRVGEPQNIRERTQVQLVEWPIDS